MVLIFCVEFQELSHLTRDLSQAVSKNGYTFATVANSKCVTVFLKQTLIVSVAQFVTTDIFFSA